MALTLEEANRIIAGTIAQAQELNIKVNVAVCDAGGRLVAGGLRLSRQGRRLRGIWPSQRRVDRAGRPTHAQGNRRG